MKENFPYCKASGCALKKEEFQMKLLASSSLPGGKRRSLIMTQLGKSGTLGVSQGIPVPLMPIYRSS